MDSELCLAPVGMTMEGYDPSGQGNLEDHIQVKRKQTLITPASGQYLWNVTTGLLVINWLECNRGLIDY